MGRCTVVDMTKDEFDASTGYNEFRTVKVAYLNTTMSGYVRRAAGKDGYMFRLHAYADQSSRRAHELYFSDVEWIG